MCWLGLARCARKGPTGCGFKRCLTWRAALQGAPACRTTCQPSRALDQSRSCTAPSAPDGRMSPSRTSADSSTSSHFITAPQVKPAGCAGAAGEQEARDERASVRARAESAQTEPDSPADSAARQPTRPHGGPSRLAAQPSLLSKGQSRTICVTESGPESADSAPESAKNQQSRQSSGADSEARKIRLGQEAPTLGGGLGAESPPGTRLG